MKSFSVILVFVLANQYANAQIEKSLGIYGGVGKEYWKRVLSVDSKSDPLYFPLGISYATPDSNGGIAVYDIQYDLFAPMVKVRFSGWWDHLIVSPNPSNQLYFLVGPGIGLKAAVSRKAPAVVAFDVRLGLSLTYVLKDRFNIFLQGAPYFGYDVLCALGFGGSLEMGIRFNL
jgi:hypothetical protein